MVNSVLIFVPHPDDEINIAGGLFDLFYEKKVYTTVVVCTNGDYYIENSARRYIETEKTKKIFRYQELVYLGYGDCYEGRHIYDTKYDDISVSHAGRVQTYIPGGNSEYCYTKYNKHNPYNRIYYKNDIKTIILDKQPDLLICVDLDKHIEHKCVSLLFDECMGEILKENINYRPTILKGFAYNGVWCGPNDFFDIISKPTRIDSSDNNLAIKTFPYCWENRIRIKCSKKVQSLNLSKNSIFRALLAHGSQSDFYKLGFCALACFPRIANPDACFWYRNPNNLCLYSEITASTGDSSFLNDFLLAKPSKFIEDDLPYDSLGWRPEVNDKNPTITIKLPYKTNISAVVIYQNINSSIEAVKIKCDNIFEKEYYELKENVIKLSLPNIPTKMIEMVFASGNGLNINEIELYEQQYELFPWGGMPFSEYKYVAQKKSRISAFVSKCCYKVFLRGVLLWSKLKNKSNDI